MSFRTVIAASGIAIVLVYAIGSGLWVNTGDNWYANLNKPSWQPPGFIFGIIWPYNFIVLGIAATVIGQRASKPAAFTYIAFFALSVIAALTWAYLFYVPHQLTASAIALGGAAILTAVLVGLTWSVTRVGAIALLPYLIWVSLATSLAFGYARLNA